MADVEEIRKYWEVPAIAYFFSLFKAAFALTDFDIEELEEALVTSATPEGSFLIESMVSQLLKGIYGRNIAKENQQKCLQNLLSEYFAGQGKANPLETCVFMELPMHHKIPALYQLCHLRCDGNDVGDVLKGYDGDDLRVLPLGQDASGAQYWYYFGVQLYKEDPEPEPAPEEKKSRPQKKKKHFIFKAKKKKGRKKNAKKKGKEETKEEEAEKPPEVPPPPPAPTRWHLVCSTLEDWEKLAESLKGSKNRQEKVLYKLIMQDFLPEIPTIIQEKEKERRRRLMELEPRRASSRLEIKKQQQEEQMKVLIEEEERQRSEESAYRRKALEEQRQEWQRQEREAREKARHERELAREDRARRAQLREERLALMAEGKEIPAELYYDGNSRSSDKMSEETLSRMYQVLDAIRAHKDAWPFLQPVTEDIAPNYYEVIKRPMDLSTISEKLEAEAYNSENQFFADFKQIFSNCKRYNGVQSDVGQIGIRLKKYFDKCVKRYMPSEEDANSDDEYHTFTRVAAASTSSRPRRQASTKALQTMHQSEDSEDDWYEPPPVPRRSSGRELDLRHQVEDVRRARQKLSPNLAMYSVLNKSGQPARLAPSTNGLHMSMSSLGLGSGGSMHEVLSAESNQRKVVLSTEDFKRLIQSGKMKVVNTEAGFRVQLRDGVQLTEKVVEPPPLLPGPTEIPSREDSTGPDLPPTLTIQKPATTSAVPPVPRVLNLNVSSPSSLTSPIPGMNRIVYPNLAANRVNGARGRYPQGTVANRPAKKRKVYDPPDDDDEDEVYIPPPPRKFRKVYDPAPMDTKDLPSRHTGQEGLVDPFESKRSWGGSRKRSTMADWNKTAGTDWDSAKDSQSADNQRPFGNLPSAMKEETGSAASLSMEPGPSQQQPHCSSADSEAKRAFGFDSVAWGERSLASRPRTNDNRNGNSRQEESMEYEEDEEEEEEEEEQEEDEQEEDKQEEEAEQEEEDEQEEEEQEEEEEQGESIQDSSSQSSCEGQSEHFGDASQREEAEQEVVGQERGLEESNEEDSIDSQSQHDSVSQEPVSDNSSDQDCSLPSLHGQNSSQAGVSSYTNHSVNAGRHDRSVFSMMGPVPTAPLPVMDNGSAVHVAATQKTEVQRPVTSQGVTVSYDQQSGNQSRQVEPILERFQYF